MRVSIYVCMKNVNMNTGESRGDWNGHEIRYDTGKSVMAYVTWSSVFETISAKRVAIRSFRSSPRSIVYDP